MDAVEDRACQDAEYLEQGGFDAILLENFGDAPFFPRENPPATIAAMARVASSVRKQVRTPLGINVLRNDAKGALAICAAADLHFMRVNVHTGTMFTDQGPLSGQAHETIRTRRVMAPDVAILADVFVKHATPPAGSVLEDAAKDCWARGLPDALVVTGAETGVETSIDHLTRVRRAAPDAPVYIGSGLTPNNIDLLRYATGALVGSSVKLGGTAGAAVDPKRVAQLMKAVANTP